MSDQSINLPDFMIIGAMKCATSTLHEQLAVQPGIFMSTPKEPNFFSDDEVYAKGLSWYSNLFADAGSALKGESSTHYTKFPTYPNTIERMQAAGLDAKLIYVIRDPRARLVSHYMHEWSQGIINEEINVAIDRYPELIDYSRYGYQLMHYLETYMRENMLVVFYEDLTTNSQPELERICKFIGYSGVPKWDYDMRAKNVSSERIREFPMYDLLINSAVMSSIRRAIVPRALRERVKKKLTLNERPVLTERSNERLNKLFDEDLANLKSNFDVDPSRYVRS